MREKGDAGHGAGSAPWVTREARFPLLSSMTSWSAWMGRRSGVWSSRLGNAGAYKRWFRTCRVCPVPGCGLWHLAFYNDGKDKEMVSFNTVVLGRYGISEVLCHQRKHGSAPLSVEGTPSKVVLMRRGPASILRVHSFIHLKLALIKILMLLNS